MTTEKRKHLAAWFSIILIFVTLASLFYIVKEENHKCTGGKEMIAIGSDHGGYDLSCLCVCLRLFCVTLCSVILSVICAVIGILLSILAGTPVGSTIVAADMAAFFINCVAGRMMGRR